VLSLGVVFFGLTVFAGLETGDDFVRLLPKPGDILPGKPIKGEHQQKFRNAFINLNQRA